MRVRSTLFGLSLLLVSLLLGACDLVNPEPDLAPEPDLGPLLFPTRITNTQVLSDVTVSGGTTPALYPDFYHTQDGGFLLSLYADPSHVRLYNSSYELVKEKRFEDAYTHSFSIERGLVLVGYDSEQEEYRASFIDPTLQVRRQLSWAYPPLTRYRQIDLRLAEVGAGRYVLLIVRSGFPNEPGPPGHVLVGFSENEGLLWVKSGEEVLSDSELKLTDIAADGQGGFVGVGTPFTSGEQSILVGFDPQGNAQWQRSYAVRSVNRLTEVTRLHNGDYLLMGQSQGSGRYREHGWYVRADAQGNEIWNSGKLWTEEEKGQSFMSLQDYNVNLVYSTSSRLYVITDRTIGVGRTLEVGPDGTLLRQYNWPFTLDSDCSVARIQPRGDSQLDVLAKCLGLTRDSATLRTVLYTIE